MTGDGKLDVCARLGSGMVCWPFEGSRFGAAIIGPAWSDAAGWSQPRYHRTIRLADVDADGRMDLCGRDSTGVSCWLSDGSGFPTRFAGPAWSDSAGWGAAEYYATIRISGGRRAVVERAIAWTVTVEQAPVVVPVPPKVQLDPPAEEVLGGCGCAQSPGGVLLLAVLMMRRRRML